MEVTATDLELIYEALNHYDILGVIRFVKPYGSGHINDTYQVQTDQAAYIFQRVNKNIFDREALVSNYQHLYAELDAYQRKTGQILTPKPIVDRYGQYHVYDRHGSACRVLSFLPNSTTFDIATDSGVAYQAANAFGQFQCFLNGLNPELFQDTIANFHNPTARYEQFQESCTHAITERNEQAATSIHLAEKYSGIIKEIEHVLDSKTLPDRVTHNDTKLNNVVFANGSNYVIDLDTVMKGSIIFDFGDMVRTFTSPVAEDHSNIGESCFRLDYFDKLCGGYLHPLKGSIDKAEANHLILGTKSVIYVQALRFLGDYLIGDPYFKTTYETHNLVRAKTQFKLLEDFIRQEESAESIVQKYI